MPLKVHILTIAWFLAFFSYVQALILTIWVLYPCLGEDSLKSRMSKYPLEVSFPSTPPWLCRLSKAGFLFPGDMQGKREKTLVFTQRLSIYFFFLKLHNLESWLWILFGLWPSLKLLFLWQVWGRGCVQCKEGNFKDLIEIRNFSQQWCLNTRTTKILRVLTHSAKPRQSLLIP